MIFCTWGVLILLQVTQTLCQSGSSEIWVKDDFDFDQSFQVIASGSGSGSGSGEKEIILEPSGAEIAKLLTEGLHVKPGHDWDALLNGDPEGKVGVIKEVRRDDDSEVQTVEVEWNTGLDQIHKMGEDDTYELKLAQLGHYEWAQWSQCSAKCGHGSKHRIQTTNCIDGDYCVGEKSTENKPCQVPCRDGQQLVDLMQYGTHVKPGMDWDADAYGPPKRQVGVVTDFRSDERNLPISVEVKWKSGADRFHDMGKNGRYELDIAKSGHYAWGRWRSCSVSCGIGTRTRRQRKKCLDGDYCEGERLTEPQQCFQPCPGVHEVYCDGQEGLQNYEFFFELHISQNFAKEKVQNCYWQTSDGTKHHVIFPHSPYINEDK